MVLEATNDKKIWFQTEKILKDKYALLILFIILSLFDPLFYPYFSTIILWMSIFGFTGASILHQHAPYSQLQQMHRIIEFSSSVQCGQTRITVGSHLRTTVYNYWIVKFNCSGNVQFNLRQGHGGKWGFHMWFIRVSLLGIMSIYLPPPSEMLTFETR